MKARITVKITSGKKASKKTFPRNATVADAARLAGLNRETVVPKLNGEVVSLAERLRDGDELELVRIIYGG